MKTIIKSVTVAGVAALAATTLYARSSNSQGTEIIHYSTRVPMTNSQADPSTLNASGNVQVNEAIQGNADKETLTVTAKGLTESTAYSVAATVSGTSTNIGSVTTDKRGSLKAIFSNNGKGKNNAGAPPTPLTSITEVDVVNPTNQTVLAADMTTPQTFQFMVRKDVVDTNSGAAAGITVSVNSRGALFGLNASGLTGGADYLLVFNGKVVQTNTATARGGLRFISPLTSTNGVVTPFQLQSVALEDTNSTTVISTTIP